MQTKFKIFSLVLSLSLALLGALALTSSVSAASTTDLQPASVITYNEELVVNHTGRFNSVYIGKQGVGGVTFFNGTIVNSTTGTGGSNNPVTFGDDVRIDGQIYRTEVGGSNNLKLADSIQPQTNNTYSLGTSALKMKDGYFAGTLTTGTLAASALSGTGIVNSTNLLDATIATADLADSAVTSAKIVDGTIATADLTDSAVTSAKITNGTITGSDISSSADLSVDDINTTGDINQELSNNGAVKALLYVDSSTGHCTRSWTFDDSTVTCNNIGTGAYAIDFNFDISTRFWNVSVVTNGVAAMALNVGTNRIAVFTYDVYTHPTQSTNAFFMLVVY